MKPTVTIDKPQAPTIRMHEGARNAIVPSRQADVIKLPAAQVAKPNSLVGAIGSLFQGGSKTDNRSYADNRQITNNDNRQLTQVDGRSFTTVNHDETNITNISDSYNQSYSVQNSTSHQITDASTYNTHIDNSQHYTDASQHWTTNITDNSQHYTDNSHNVSMSFAQASAGQSMMLGLFFGNGFEKVLLALTMLGIAVVVFFTELLMIAGGLVAFAIAYKTAKFAWQRHEANVMRQHQAAEAEKQRRHELELARLRSQPVLHIHVNSTDEAVKVAAKMKQQPQAQPQKQPQALPEPTYFEADAPSAVSPTKTEKVKAAAGKAAGKAKEAAKKHAKRQANLFVDGMKHEVLGVKRK